MYQMEGVVKCYLFSNPLALFRHNWEEKLKSLKIPVFNVFVDWENIRGTAQDQHLKVPIWNLSISWEKFCPNLSLTVENLNKTCPSTFQTQYDKWNTPYFQIIKNYHFVWEKWDFGTVGNSADTAEGLALGKILLVLLPIYFQILNMLISARTDKYKHKYKHKHNLGYTIWQYTIHDLCIN